jgi:hypothetical protein
MLSTSSESFVMFFILLCKTITSPFVLYRYEAQSLSGKNITYKWGFHSSENVDYGLQGGNNTSPFRWLTTFWRNIIFIFSVEGNMFLQNINNHLQHYIVSLPRPQSLYYKCQKTKVSRKYLNLRRMMEVLLYKVTLHSLCRAPSIIRVVKPITECWVRGTSWEKTTSMVGGGG